MKTLFNSTCIALALFSLAAQAQQPDVNSIPAYKKEFEVVGRLRIAGSELKGVVEHLVQGFQKFHPGAKLSTNFMTSSEGALGMSSRLPAADLGLRGGLGRPCSSSSSSFRWADSGCMRCSTPPRRSTA